MPGVSQLFKPLKNDFRRMASRDNLALLQAGALGALTFSPWDRRVQDAAWGQGSVHSTLKPGALVGGFIFQSSAAIATYAVGRATKQTRIAELGVDLVRAQIVSQTTTQALKFATQRTRPDGTSLSFPSGHTSSSFATASVLHAHFGPKVGIPAYAMAAWVAASRVQMKRHHVSDVIVGASIGLLAGRSVTFGHGSTRFGLSPMAVPGGGGINLVRIGGRQD
jgi:membrane-associated phospholipid phosphatase